MIPAAALAVDRDDLLHAGSSITNMDGPEVVANNKEHALPAKLILADLSEEGKAKMKKNIYKNVVIVSFCFLLNFTAFQGLSRLQSSLHRDEGMGVITQSALYAALIISCMFVPKIMISQIGHKFTIPLSFCGYILWMAANGYAVWGTMVTASIIVGICAAPLWTAQCAYFTKLATRYAQLSSETDEAVVSRFFGIFYTISHLSSITGSIITSTVLRPVAQNENETWTLPPEQIRMMCGANDCPWNNETNLNFLDPNTNTVWTMVGIFIGLAVVAVVIMIVAVDRLPEDLREPKLTSKRELGQLAISTFKHLCNPYQLLLVPITMYSGFEQASYTAEWNKSYISCTLGIWMVGLTTLPYGVVNAIVSFTCGWLVKYTGRLPVFLLGITVDLSIQFTILFYAPDPESEYALFIISGCWGLTDGIWNTQINALYGSIFSSQSEAAFSVFLMWESLGFFIAFAYSNYLCTREKIIILMVVLLIGNALYLCVEASIYKKRKSGIDPVRQDGAVDITTVVAGCDTKAKNSLDGVDNPGMKNDTVL